MRSVICMETRSGYPVNKNTERKKKKTFKSGLTFHNTKVFPPEYHMNQGCLEPTLQIYAFIIPKYTQCLSKLLLNRPACKHYQYIQIRLSFITQIIHLQIINICLKQPRMWSSLLELHISYNILFSDCIVSITCCHKTIMISS